MSSGPFGQQAITVQESQLGGWRFSGTFKAGMCFEYLIFTFFFFMVSPFFRPRVPIPLVALQVFENLDEPPKAEAVKKFN